MTDLTNDFIMVTMMPTHLKTEADNIPVAGSLQQLAGLPDSQDRPLFNAENLTIIEADAEAGPLFVTGSETACEIRNVAPGRYDQREIPIAASGISKRGFRNGITVYDRSLYLAYADVHQAENSFIGDLRGDAIKIDQNSLSLLFLMFIEMTSNIDSYILRADLNQPNFQFKNAVRLPGRCLANGLDGDGKGSLYTANSAPRSTAAILKITCSGGGMTPAPEPWHHPLENGVPNGVKVSVCGRYLYMTCFHLLPVLSSTLQRVEISDNGAAEKAEIVYRRYLSIFDDFDVVDNGFVIANISDFGNYPDLASLANYGSGSLLFMTRDGQVKGVFKDKDLKHPSAVKVVKQKTNGFDAGDILITDKGRHCVLRFVPDPGLCQWLLGSVEPTAV